MRRWRVPFVWLKRPAFVALLLTTTASWGVAAVASGLPEALRNCAQEQDDSRRLACYDKEVPRLAATPDKSFGLSAEQQRKQDAAETHEKSKPQILSSVVTAVSQRADGRKVFTLANGELWIQGEAWEVFDVKVGDAVTIKPGTLGSFHLSAASGASSRVTRAR